MALSMVIILRMTATITTLYSLPAALTHFASVSDELPDTSVTNLSPRQEANTSARASDGASSAQRKMLQASGFRREDHAGNMRPSAPMDVGNDVGKIQAGVINKAKSMRNHGTVGPALFP
jgi:hypothetical protein